ncbi:MAG: hypothetical protein LKI53_07555 [Bacteroidales bacterium]|jgi:hypothetical protein|nr:hypothetical protein [Bacteroidales bacterium]
MKISFKKNFLNAGLLALLLFVGGNLHSQITISGTVRFAKSNKLASDVNVLLLSGSGRTLLSFTNTNSAGFYSLKYSGNLDSLLIRLTGFNIKTTEKKIKAVSQRLDFQVIFQALSLKEVVYRAKSITRRSDTLDYNVASYIDSLDFSIADVIKKMPGISVKKSGQIYYNDKPINRFYVEGLDMMGSRYGVAVNNIHARDIATVQVLENHQPIKALKKTVLSNSAAINLKLKNKAKGTTAYTILAGAGYKPWMWDAHYVMMRFKAKYQYFLTYEGNNCGEDILSEFSPLYGETHEAYSMLGIYKPGTPDTDVERYMKNNTNAVSLNSIFKLAKDVTLRFNTNYYHDIQKFDAFSDTKYYISDKDPVNIKENTHAHEQTDNINFRTSYESNKESGYLNDKFNLISEWDKNRGSVITGGDTCLQKLNVPKIQMTNHFNLLRVFGKIRTYINSDVNFYHLPSTLKVKPVLFPEIFGNATGENKSAVQRVDVNRFSTDEHIFGNYDFGTFNISVNAGIKANTYDMDGSLYENNHSGSITQAADSLTNNIFSRRLDGYSGIFGGYRTSNMEFTIGTNIDYMYQKINDRNIEQINNTHKTLFSPGSSLYIAITPDLKFNARASCFEDIGLGDNNYSGYIMTDYRTISSREGKLRDVKFQNYSADLKYGNALISLFASLGTSYQKGKSNLMYGSEYLGSLTKIESFAIDHDFSSLTSSGRIEKRFDNIETTIAIPASITTSKTQVLRQGDIMDVTSHSFTTGLEISSRLCEAFRTDYTLTYGRSKSEIKNNTTELKPFKSLHQKISLFITFSKKLTLTAVGEHYYNNSITSGSKSMFFTDASLSYKTKRFQYKLTGWNLSNTSRYHERIYSDITDYEYNYEMRPISLLLTVRYSLR